MPSHNNLTPFLIHSYVWITEIICGEIPIIIMCDDSKFHKECLHQIKLLIFPMDNIDSILDVMMDNRFHVSNTYKTGKPFFFLNGYHVAYCLGESSSFLSSIPISHLHLHVHLVFDIWPPPYLSRMKTQPCSPPTIWSFSLLRIYTLFAYLLL